MEQGPAITVLDGLRKWLRIKIGFIAKNGFRFALSTLRGT